MHTAQGVGRGRPSVLIQEVQFTCLLEILVSNFKVVNVVVLIEIYHDSNVLQIVEWDQMDFEKELLNQYVRLCMVYDDMIPVITFLYRIYFNYIDFTIFMFFKLRMIIT